MDPKTSRESSSLLICPSKGSISPDIERSKVVFPDPELPMMAINSPGETVNESFRTNQRSWTRRLSCSISSRECTGLFKINGNYGLISFSRRMASLVTFKCSFSSTTTSLPLKILSLNAALSEFISKRASFKIFRSFAEMLDRTHKVCAGTGPCSWITRSLSFWSLSKYLLFPRKT